MSGNYRVMRDNQPGEEEFFGLHAVAYEADGQTVRNWSKHPAVVCAETVAGLRRLLLQMVAALEQPVLEPEGEL